MSTDSATASTLAPRRAPVVGRVAGAQATAVVAQALGALQLLLLLRAGAGRSSDAYFVVFAAGQLVISIWVLGVADPRQLADPALSWRGRGRAAAVAAGACALGASAYLLAVGYPAGTVLPVGGLLAVATAAAAAANCQAAVLACAGSPKPLAGVTILPNLMACAGLVVSMWHGSAVVDMCVGVAAGNLALLPLQAGRVRRTLHDRPTAAGAASPTPRWLLYGSVVGNLAPLVLQASLATLPGGRVSAFSAASRLALAATSVGVSSVLPLLVQLGPVRGRHHPQAVPADERAAADRCGRCSGAGHSSVTACSRRRCWCCSPAGPSWPRRRPC